MKRLNPRSGIWWYALSLAIAVGLGACSGQSPFQPEGAGGKKKLTFLNLGTTLPALSKTNLVETVTYVNHTKAKTLSVSYSPQGSQAVIDVSTKIKRNSLGESQDIRLSLNDATYFQGTVEAADGSVASTSKSTLVNITVSNADFSGLDASQLGAYYEDPASGDWVPMNYYSLDIDPAAGNITLVKGKLPMLTSFALYPVSEPGESAESGSGGSGGAIIAETVEHVSYANGGELIIDYKAYEHGGGAEEVKTTFKVFSETISQDADLKLSMSDGLLSGDVDVTFQPHGITFSENALLNIEAKNIDLSGVDISSLGIYYDNQETGEWEPMVVKEVIVNVEQGYLKIIDAEIPHFSRYAVAH